MKAKKMKIGKITQEDITKANKIASREMDMVDSTGWVSTHKVHKSAKSYKRNSKHQKSQNLN